MWSKDPKLQCVSLSSYFLISQFFLLCKMMHYCRRHSDIEAVSEWVIKAGCVVCRINAWWCTTRYTAVLNRKPLTTILMAFSLLQPRLSPFYFCLLLKWNGEGTKNKWGGNDKCHSIPTNNKPWQVSEVSMNLRTSQKNHFLYSPPPVRPLSNYPDKSPLSKG